MSKRKTAIIIGAGPAGLTAAYELLTRSDVPATAPADDRLPEPHPRHFAPGPKRRRPPRHAGPRAPFAQCVGAETSAEWGAQRVKGLSIKNTLAHVLRNALRRTGDVRQKDTETSLIEQFMYPKLGPGQLWEPPDIQ